MRVQHAGLGCWLPLWVLGEAAAAGDGDIAPDPPDIEMRDWQRAVEAVREERQAGLLKGTGGWEVVDFPELSEAAHPMDYELSPGSRDAVAGKGYLAALSRWSPPPPPFGCLLLVFFFECQPAVLKLVHNGHRLSSSVLPLFSLPLSLLSSYHSLLVSYLLSFPQTGPGSSW
jgi:hypothetical protein